MSRKVCFHLVTLRTICHATEDEKKVLTAFRVLTGDAKVERTETVGYFSNRIVLFETKLTRSRDIQDLWSTLSTWGVLSQVKDEVEERVDERYVFHLRFCKQEAYKGSLVLGGAGDTIAVSARIAAFPPGREEALRIVQGAISSTIP